MQNPLNPENTRLHRSSTKRTLKDGSIKIYHYEKKYNAKTQIVHVAGRNQIHDKISACFDADKIALVLAYMTSIGI